MRMLLKAVIDTETGTEVFRSGKVAETLNQTQHSSNPKPCTASVRMGSAPSLSSSTWPTRHRYPSYVSPYSHKRKAKITLTPCMNLEDLQKGVSQALEALR